MVLTVNGSEGDFLKNLNAVKVDGKTFMQKVLQDLIITMKQQKI